MPSGPALHAQVLDVIPLALPTTPLSLLHLVPTPSYISQVSSTIKPSILPVFLFPSSNAHPEVSHHTPLLFLPTFLWPAIT